MKKILFSIITLAFSFVSIAQHSIDRSAKTLYVGEEEIHLNNESVTHSTFKPQKGPIDKASVGIPIGTSANIHSIVRDRQNQVVYNKDINTIAFGHRQNNGSPGNPDIISFDYSTDGGSTWTINRFQMTPTLDGTGNNYPSTGIYNPISNTDTNNAFIVQTGTKSTFDKSFRSSAKLDGTLLDETYSSNSIIGPSSSSNEHGGYGLYVTSLGDAWYVSSNWNITGDVNLHLTGSYHDYFITKGVFNSGNNNFDWITTDTITPSWYSTPTTTGYYTNLATSPNMAWSLDGLTGYMVTMGADSSGNNNSMWRPYIMKTTDGGSNWVRFPDFDFSTDASIQNYIWSLNTNPSEIRPFFGDFDVVVDNNNELRIICELHSGFSGHPDSLSYYFAAKESKFLFEIATNTGSGTYDITFVDSVYADDYMYDGSPSAREHLIRPQASRSQDGSKIFYTWLTTESLLGPNNEFPSIRAVGHELSTNNWTAVTNLSLSNNSEYTACYQTMAVDVIENGQDKTWELPIVYVTAAGGSPLSNASNPGQYYFLKGVGFDQIDFQPASINDKDDLSNNIVLYPNPTKDVVTIKIKDASRFNFVVRDVLGRKVAEDKVNGSKVEIDLSNNTKGIYFVEIHNAKDKVIKKLLLTE